MRVLFLDDDKYFAQAYVESLQIEGFKVDFFNSDESAIEVLQSGDRYDVVIQDVMRPTSRSLSPSATIDGLLTGVVFYEKYLKQSYPTTPVIFLTNRARHVLEEQLKLNPLCKIISKFETPPQMLPEIVRAVVEARIETFYQHNSQKFDLKGCWPIVTDLRTEIKRYLSCHPEKLHELSPRNFEFLVADILRDLGLNVEVTKATRDGGVDIYAHLRHEVGSFLMLIECKLRAPERPVGIDVVQRLYGIQQTKSASKGLIVTTSYFTEPAQKEASQHNGLIDLKDYAALKEWLKKYK